MSWVSIQIDTHGSSRHPDGTDADEITDTAPSDDPTLGLRAALALRRTAERVKTRHVASARARGWSWKQIGDALGVTHQSVHSKYGKTLR